MEQSNLKLIKILNHMINNKLTFEEAATFFGMEKQELLENIEKNLDILKTEKPKLLEQIKKQLEEERKVEEIASFIIENEATNDEAAEAFDVSKSTIQKSINKKLLRISKKLYDKVKETQKLVLKRSQILGGKIGKRGPSITDFETLEMAEERIKNNYTFEELERIYSVPSSTIHEAFNRLNYPETKTNLEKVTLINKRQTPRKNQLKTDKEITHESRKK